RRIHAAIGVWLDRAALLQKPGYGGAIEGAALHAGSPVCELRRRHGNRIEAHVRESIAAEMRRKSEILSRLVRLQVELSDHSIHRVNHASQPRHKEHVENRG